MKIHHSCLCKVKRDRRLFETRMELKQLERKLDFLEIYLKIGVLGIEFKNWNFGN